MIKKLKTIAYTLAGTTVTLASLIYIERALSNIILKHASKHARKINSVDEKNDR
jgi:hypothetical protein